MADLFLHKAWGDAVLTIADYPACGLPPAARESIGDEGVLPYGRNTSIVMGMLPEKIEVLVALIF
jgi:hypothetical protein